MRAKYEKIENDAYEITVAFEQRWQLILQKKFARSQFSIIFSLNFSSTNHITAKHFFLFSCLEK